MWASVEVDIGIVCVCIPALRPLLPKKDKVSRDAINGLSTIGSHQIKKRIINDGTLGDEQIDVEKADNASPTDDMAQLNPDPSSGSSRRLSSIKLTAV